MTARRDAHETMLAACGLDCGPCPIRRLPFDDEAARACVDWYRKEGWLSDEEGPAEAIERKMYCRGCLGDRDVHWSASDEAVCWILECAVDKRGLTHCGQCDLFPCDRLVEWSTKNERYGAAMERLRALAGG